MAETDTKRHLAYLAGDAERPAPFCAWPRLKAETRPRRWCIVQSEHRREVTAEQEIKGAGFLVYVPRFKTRLREPRNHRRWIDTVRPLFPGYLFVDCADEPVPVGWLAKRRGVRDVLRIGDAPQMVPDQVIEQLRTDEGINFGQPYRKQGAPIAVKAGDQVRLTDGPFTGFYGLIGEIDPKDRITVFIEAFGRVIPISGLSVDQLEAQP